MNTLKIQLNKMRLGKIKGTKDFGANLDGVYSIAQLEHIIKLIKNYQKNFSKVKEYQYTENTCPMCIKETHINNCSGCGRSCGCYKNSEN